VPQNKALALKELPAPGMNRIWKKTTELEILCEGGAS
jgi:hypothetical protein